MIDEVSYYEYVGVIMDAERRDKLRRALGPANKASRHFQCAFQQLSAPESNLCCLHQELL